MDQVNNKPKQGNQPTAKEEWTEEQLEEGLKQLKLLHIKCRALRTTLPVMLEPLSTRHASAEDTFVAFTKCVTNASKQLSDFKTLYTSDDSQRVLEQARKSREAEPKGIAPWRYKDHPDWHRLDEETSAHSADDKSQG